MQCSECKAVDHECGSLSQPDHKTSAIRQVQPIRSFHCDRLQIPSSQRDGVRKIGILMHVRIA
jgi:hypothetical protein